MTTLDQLAIDLCQSYQGEGIASFVIRTTDDNKLRVIGLQLPPEIVGRMLRDAGVELVTVEDDEVSDSEGGYTSCGACNGYGCDWCMDMGSEQ